jgi:hypothetical protein
MIARRVVGEREQRAVECVWSLPPRDEWTSRRPAHAETGACLAGQSIMLLRTLLAAGVLLLAFYVRAHVTSSGAALPCQLEGTLVRTAALPEASGIAAGRTSAARLWAINDSGPPVLFALDVHGAIAGQLEITGATLEDWEAIAAGPCAGGSCLYVADIGDNDASRDHITVYRISEPAGASGSATVSAAFDAVYPDGPQDAEALLSAPDGTLYIVTKGTTGPVALYRFPRRLRSGASVRLERIGERGTGKPNEDQRITDGAVSRDGRWVVLRSRGSLMFYRAASLLSGNWQEERVVDLAGVGEPQGEGVAFGENGLIYLAGEGGGKSQPGTFARLRCTLTTDPPQRSDGR